ncbi:MAG: cytochrome c oxidase subunit II [Fluviicola sp.]|nr:cytochrome c oxidase subunit II [Fluviicola sp.]
MSRLIVLIVIVLGVLAIAQLVRLYELSSKLRDRREEDITNRDNKLNAGLLLAFMVFMFGGFIWLMLAYGWTGRGDAASVSGAQTDWLLNLNFWIIIIVFFLTNGLLFGFAFKYVRKPGVKAYYFPHDNRLELIWTVVPAIVLAIIIILGLKSWNEQTDEPGKEAIRVELFSKQFGWTVRMSGEDNTLGFFDYKLTNENNPLALMTAATIQNAIDSMENGMSGIKALERKLNDRTIMLIPEERDLMVTDLDRKERLIRLLYQMKVRHNSKLDVQAMDDVTFTEGDTLYLCKNQEYEFNFRAKDVIHSAYFPHFRAQMNTVPGQTTRFKFTPSVTTDEMRDKMNNQKFNYILMCNKICGTSHYKMKLMVVVLEPKDYEVWSLKTSYTDSKAHQKRLAKILKRTPTPKEREDWLKASKTFKNVYQVGKPVEAPAAAGTTDSIPADGAAMPIDSLPKA